VIDTHAHLDACGDAADELIARALAAYLPKTAPIVLRALGQPEDDSWDKVEAGRTVAAEGIEPAAPLFPRGDSPAAAA